MSEVSLCNEALTAVGGNIITSFGDGTKEANLCQIHYVSARDAVLEAHDWSFTRKRVIIAADATKPEFGFDNRFLIPFDSINIRTVSQNSLATRAEVLRWAVEGRFIVANAPSPIFVRYNFIETDDASFSKLFEQALVAYLAATFSLPLAESPNLQQQHFGIYGRKVDEAAAVDGLQGRTELTYGGRAERVRWTRGIPIDFHTIGTLG